MRSIQVSFTKAGRGIYGVITPLKRRQSRLIGQDNIDSWNIFDVHEFFQFHTSDYFIFQQVINIYKYVIQALAPQLLFSSQKNIGSRNNTIIT